VVASGEFDAVGGAVAAAERRLVPDEFSHGSSQGVEQVLNEAKRVSLSV
jgi:hypothetical protein